MGILDSAHRAGKDAEHGQILRANIEVMAGQKNLSYDDAVIMFSELVGRSRQTVYIWMNKKTGRPIPVRHYNLLVSMGIIDPYYNSPEEFEWRYEVVRANLRAIETERNVDLTGASEILGYRVGRKPSTVERWAHHDRKKIIPRPLFYRLMDQGVLKTDLPGLVPPNK